MFRVYKKIAVIGTCGAGKSVFAKALANILDCSHIELDALYWSPGWQKVPDDMFRNRVLHEVSADSWILDGNYGLVRNLIWSRAELIIWLDYSFGLIMRRLLMRTLIGIFRQTVRCNGNRENWQKQFFQKDSILWWMISTYARRRREYQALWMSKEFSHAKFIRFSQPREAESWLTELAKTRHSV
jgi:adenylate kinase family enzyme